MKKLLIFFSCLIFTNCTQKVVDTTIETQSINSVLDQWHQAAAKPDYDNYFKLMSEHSIFIGTDATENWNKKEFMVWAKPYFEKGKAWSFTALERNIYFDASGQTAWFDELLNTEMKICRGSGVMVKEKNNWRIKHYVLSMTIPNDLIDTVINIKTSIENVMILELKDNKQQM